MLKNYQHAIIFSGTKMVTEGANSWQEGHNKDDAGNDGWDVGVRFPLVDHVLGGVGAAWKEINFTFPIWINNYYILGEVSIKEIF